jgi:hypothetical protein
MNGRFWPIVLKNSFFVPLRNFENCRGICKSHLIVHSDAVYWIMVELKCGRGTPSASKIFEAPYEARIFSR